MRKFNYIFTILFASVFFISCEDQADDFFSGNSTNGEEVGTILTPVPFNYEYGNTPVVEMPIEVVGTIESYTVFVQLQTESGDSEKAVLANGSESQTISVTNSELFNLVPVNGNIFNDDSLQLGDRFVFSFEVQLPGFAEPSPLNAKTIQAAFACPLDADFTGTYVINDVTGSPLVGSLFGDGVEVTVTESSTFGRQFEAVYGADLGIGNPAIVVPFELLCGQVVIGSEFNSGLQCTTGIVFGSPVTRSTFDASDDTYFEITLGENITGDCGAGAFDTTISLTKVE